MALLTFKRGLVVSGVLMAALAVGTTVVWQSMVARLDVAHDGFGGNGVFVTVEVGDSTAVIARRFVEAGVVADRLMFRFAVWYSGADRGLQAGEYFIDQGLSPVDLVDKVANGRVFLRGITFPEGLTLTQMASIFETEGFGQGDAFTAASERVELIADLDPNATNLEGYLFPETYSLPRDATADDLVEAMVDQFRVVFDEELQARAVERQMSVRELVTLAAIIEKETGSVEEHPLVSAVFNNRLRLGMPLQSDPTVIFSLEQDGLYDGNLTRDNLQHDSPYNTYRYSRLPPGPIAAPGGAALRAALAPADVSYLYFVSRNDGTHAFANTLQEHNRNVREFQINYFRRQRSSQ